jgi:GTP-binding protein
MFIDKLDIDIRSGKGGDGAATFRREKFVPKGGPDGGDGGRGGHVIFTVNPQMTTLADYPYKRHYRAAAGQNGMSSRKQGRNGADIVIPVPPGTLVRDREENHMLVDLVDKEERWIAARGGRGGRGNVHFATSTNRAPRQAQSGQKAIARQLSLEVKLIADVGLVGAPNAGKSTLLSVISAARPQIADYPFTTLTPNLGIVSWQIDKSFVVADIPGLIAGAHQGKGLGLQFLRHIERTRCLAYIIDGSEAKANLQLAMLQEEISAYSPLLSEKPKLVVLSKSDIWQDQKSAQKFMRQHDALAISAATGKGLSELTARLWQIVEEQREN